MFRAAVCGSFHRHMTAITGAVSELVEHGIKVLSPADPRIVDQTGEFLFVASDKVRSIRLVEDRHLQSIRASDFVWLVAPDGYVGQSASMELGFAVANAIPVFGLSQPADLTLLQYVHRVPNIRTVVNLLKQNPARSHEDEGFLIDPHASIEAAHDTLEKIDKIFKQRRHDIRENATGQIYASLSSPRRSIGISRQLRLI